MKYWIQTYTGKMFDFENIESNEINIIDIAHALSNMCRFNGHSNRFYSVGEHSLNVSEQLNKKYSLEIALFGLLHDATEAYIPDITKPLKSYFNTKFLIEKFEDRIMNHIYNKLLNKLPTEKDKEIIKKYDLALLRLERNELFVGKELWNFPANIPVVHMKILGNSPNTTKQLFLLQYNALLKLINQENHGIQRI